MLEFTATIESPILSMLYIYKKQISANNNNLAYSFVTAQGWISTPDYEILDNKIPPRRKGAAAFVVLKTAIFQWGKVDTVKNPKQSARNYKRHAMTCQGKQSKERKSQSQAVSCGTFQSF